MWDVTIEALNINKEYDHQTIFQEVCFTYRQSQHVSVTGHNGSGKSTLLRVISGMTAATRGQIEWKVEEKKIPSYRIYEFLSFCSTVFYFDSRFTVHEILTQYHSVKPFQENLSVDDLIDLIGFRDHSHKLINELSSGMNQRVRLVLSICADVPVLFLDEPCSNLDQSGVQWYDEMISRYASDKLVFVASNDPREYSFCTDELSLMDYK